MYCLFLQIIADISDILLYIAATVWSWPNHTAWKLYLWLNVQFDLKLKFGAATPCDCDLVAIAT